MDTTSWLVLTINANPSNIPKPSKKKIYLVIGLVVVVIAIFLIGGYYAYGQYQNNKYYENYRLAVYSGDKSSSIGNETWNNLTKALDTDPRLNKTVPQIKGRLDEWKKYEEKYIFYSNEMLKYSTTDYQKRYAELMIAQGNSHIKRYDLVIQIIEGLQKNDVNKVQDAFDQSDKLEIEEQKYESEREDIRSLHPDFTARLNNEADIASNATI